MGKWKTITIKEYHRIQREKYNKALEEYHQGKRSQPPFLPMYYFMNPKTRQPRMRGYVIVTKHSEKFVRKKHLKDVS